jgi:flagellar protein FliS
MTQAMANSYLSDAVLTASPQRLVVMLYDRVLLDFDRALAALAGNDGAAAHEALVHAQDIVGELRATLDVEIWPAGHALVAVYDYVLRLLVEANVRKDARLVVDCRELMTPLRDTWRDIAGISAAA